MSYKPRATRERGAVDLRPSRAERARKFRAVKREAKRKEKRRKLERRISPQGMARLDELRGIVADAKRAIKADEDAADLDIRTYHHVNADGTIDVELRIVDLPAYQKPEGAIMILNEMLPDTVGGGNVKISQGARFSIEQKELESDDEDAPLEISVDDLKARYARHRGNLQEATYWRDASETGAKVGAQTGVERMARAFEDRGRRIDTLYVRYHWAPSEGGAKKGRK